MFIPYKSEIELDKKPCTVIAIAAICIIIFLYTHSLSESETEELFLSFGFIPLSPHFKSYIAHMFLHANFLHIIGNMLFLVLFGAALENHIGIFKFLILYLGSGIAATAGHYLLSNEMLRFEPCIGSSGAISGLLSAFLLCFPKIKIRHFYMYFSATIGFIALPAWITISYWFVEQIFFHMLTKTGLAPIAFGAHIGGFLFGIAFYFLFINKDYSSENTEKADDKNTQKSFNYNIIKADGLNDINFEKLRELFLNEKKSSVAITYFYFFIKKDYLKNLNSSDFFRVFKLLSDMDKPIDAANVLTYFINNFHDDPALAEAYFKLGKLYKTNLNDEENGKYLLNIVLTYFPDSVFSAESEELLKE